MPTTRRTVDALGRRAGRRPICRDSRADLDDALAELEAATADVLAHDPPERVDAFLAELAALTADVERIVSGPRH
jgi:ABC-type transporter Mla subunit MlaD